MSRFSARARVLAVATSTALVMSGFAVVSAPAQSATPQAGGILTLLEHEPRLDHLDPTRIYTGSRPRVYECIPYPHPRRI